MRFRFLSSPVASMPSMRILFFVNFIISSARWLTNTPQEFFFSFSMSRIAAITLAEAPGSLIASISSTRIIFDPFPSTMTLAKVFSVDSRAPASIVPVVFAK